MSGGELSCVTHSQDFMVYWMITAIYISQGHKMNFLWMPARTGITGILSFPRKRKSMKKCKKLF